MQPAFSVAVALLCLNAALAVPLLGEISSGLTNALTGKKNNKPTPAVTTAAPNLEESLNSTLTGVAEKVEEAQVSWTTEADAQDTTDTPATEETPDENAATEETAKADENEDPISSTINKLSSLPVAQFLGL